MRGQRIRTAALGLVTVIMFVILGIGVWRAADTHASIPEPTREQEAAEATVPPTTKPTPAPTIVPTAKPTPTPSEPPDPSEEPEPPTKPYTDSEIEMLAKTVWGEARGCSQKEQSLVIWTILQRVDSDTEDFKDTNTISEVITYPGAFAGYGESNPTNPEIFALCAEEAAKWATGEAPPTYAPYAVETPYLFFDGDGQHNWFRGRWKL